MAKHNLCLKKIAVITMARNDDFFLSRWVEYYGEQFGRENLYVFLDGMEQRPPKNSRGINVINIQHRDDLSRLKNDKRRINLMSDMARDLFNKGYDIVIGCDADEFLINDTDESLAEYLSKIDGFSSVSALGLDVGQDLNNEFELNKSKSFLSQRSYAVLSSRYTKPVVLFKSLRWGSGFHSIKKHNFHIDKNLYLLHFGMVDYNMQIARLSGRDPTWKKHMTRQINRVIMRITNGKKYGEWAIKFARFIQTVFRPPYAWNKPFMLGMKLVVKIPKRWGNKV